MRQLHVATSPLTNRIYAGTVLKDGQTWGAGKTDVTGAACGAVAEHVLRNGEPVLVTCNGVPKFEITVRDLTETPNAELSGPRPLAAEGSDSNDVLCGGG